MDTKPFFDGDILEYNGTWYRIGEGYKAYNPDKTADEDFYILTLASIAAELSTEQITEANVYLALGLPTTWTGRQREEYRRYMMRNPDVRTFNDMLYSIHLTDCIVFPQGHAALVPLMDNDKRFNEFRQFTGTVALRLQQMLPAYLAGYSAGASAPAAVTVPPVNVTPLQVAATPTQQESDDAMPDFGDSCMDFDFIGG